MSCCGFGFLWYISVVAFQISGTSVSGPWVTITPTQTIHLFQGKWLILPRYFHHSCHQYHRYSFTTTPTIISPRMHLNSLDVFRLEMGNKNTDFKAPSENSTRCHFSVSLHFPKKNMDEIPSSPIWNPHSLPSTSNKQNGTQSCRPVACPGTSPVPVGLTACCSRGCRRKGLTMPKLKLQPPPAPFPTGRKKKLLFWGWRPTNRILTSLKQKKSKPSNDKRERKTNV